jgi:hypothetical protein
MADLSGGLTLTIDCASLTDDIGIGEVSACSAMAAATDLPLDVLSPLLSASLFTIEEADFSSKNIYTVFMLGPVDSAYGLLRKDR